MTQLYVLNLKTNSSKLNKFFVALYQQNIPVELRNIINEYYGEFGSIEYLIYSSIESKIPDIEDLLEKYYESSDEYFSYMISKNVRFLINGKRHFISPKLLYEQIKIK
jgi:hypothetical protein